MADTQFVAFYNPEGQLVLGKRHIGASHFTLHTTQYSGNVSDAHNSISIMLDGKGYLHVAWDHHNNPLRYAKSKVPFGLELGPKMPMAGVEEEKVTYPQFFKLPDGDLIALFRSGQSGRGNLILEKYDVEKSSWTLLHRNLIDGEGQRSAYWQACVDLQGTIHLSWVWRETWDVASNHDMCYAKSVDGGKSWQKSDGAHYTLPITVSTAEYACHIPQNSELINQTSMAADSDGQPYITSYWKPKGTQVPQYHIITLKNGKWIAKSLHFRSTPFSLSGGGTKRIPIARPQMVVLDSQKPAKAMLFFRDEERGSKVSMAQVKLGEEWAVEVSDLTDWSLGMWEPSFDTELWKEKQQIHLFVQEVEQVDGEGLREVVPTMVRVLEVKITQP